MKYLKLTTFVPLCILALGLTTQAQAGVKVDIQFVKPPGVNIRGDVKITELDSGRSCTINWREDSTCTFEDVQSGFGPRPYRFDWMPSLTSAQIADVWIDIPTAPDHGLTYTHELPARNVVINNATTGGGRKAVGVFSSRTIGEALQKSRPGNRNLGNRITRPAVALPKDGSDAERLLHNLHVYHLRVPG